MTWVYEHEKIDRQQNQRYHRLFDPHILINFSAKTLSSSARLLALAVDIIQT
jgi:hypothetical protein